MPCKWAAQWRVPLEVPFHRTSHLLHGALPFATLLPNTIVLLGVRVSVGVCDIESERGREGECGRAKKRDVFLISHQMAEMQAQQAEPLRKEASN